MIGMDDLMQLADRTALEISSEERVILLSDLNVLISIIDCLEAEPVSGSEEAIFTYQLRDDISDNQEPGILAKLNIENPNFPFFTIPKITKLN